MANGAGILTDLEGASSGLRSNVFQAGTALSGALGKLERSERAIRTEIGIFNLKSFNELQKVNQELGSLSDSYRYERDLERYSFEADIRKLDFGLEKQDFLFSNTKAGLREQFKLAELGFINVLGGLADKEEGLGLYKDYLEKAKEFEQADLRGDLRTARGILASLGRSRDILRQRLGLVDSIRNIDLEINALQRQGGVRNLRALSFGAQNTAARINSRRELFFGGVSGVLGAKDLDRESLEASIKISSAVQKIQTLDLQKGRIYKTALDRKLGIKGQIEGLKRQSLKAKNSLSKLKDTLKKSNNLRDYQIAKTNLALKGVKRDIGFTEDKRELAGVSYRRKLKHQKNLDDLVRRQETYAREMTEKIFALTSQQKEQEYWNKYDKIEGEYLRGRREATRAFDYALITAYRERERLVEDAEHKRKLLEQAEEQKETGDAFIDEQKRDLEDQGRDYGVPEGQGLEVLPPE